MNKLIRGSLLAGFGLLVLILERRYRARRYVEPQIDHAARNLALAGIAAATVHLLEAPVIYPVSRMATRRRWGLTRLISARTWARDLAAVLLMDYTLYVWHILVHRVDWLWRFHLVHHVDLDLDSTTGLRFHAGELTLSIPWRVAQIAAIGVSPRAVGAWQGLTLASVLFHHSNSALPPTFEQLLGWVFVTPRMHAIHHSIDSSQRDSNFSSGLAMWDRLHGTLRLDASARDVTIGIPGYREPDDVSIVRLLELPFMEHPELPDGADHA